MKSSTGRYYLGIDQIRGIAMLIVFAWHFIHIHNGHKTGPTIFPFNIFTEGHTGVALFMALSGYLFAKLIENKKIIYRKFLLNRLLRLLPLLLFVIVIEGIIKINNGTSISEYFELIAKGIILPVLPKGVWSIVVEFHFYLILPILLFLNRKQKYMLFGILVLIIFIRLVLYLRIGQIQNLSYSTLIGRIDQFLLGILAFQFCDYIKNKNTSALIISILFLSFYYYFDYLGGFYSFSEYPSQSPLWIIIPTIEGVFYAFIISWYDNSIKLSNSWFNRFIANIGKYSYSIYLLHFFIVFRMASFIDKNVVNLSNIYVAILFSLFCFLIMIPIGYLSFNFIEKPFLRYRIKYLKE